MLKVGGGCRGVVNAMTGALGAAEGCYGNGGVCLERVMARKECRQ